MSTILDNSQGNFTTWRDALYEQVSQLKYGEHAICLITAAPAPIIARILGVVNANGMHTKHKYTVCVKFVSDM